MQGDTALQENAARRSGTSVLASISEGSFQMVSATIDLSASPFSSSTVGGILLTVLGGIAAIVLVLCGFFNVTDILFLPLILRGASPRQRLNRRALYVYLRERLSTRDAHLG